MKEQIFDRVRSLEHVSFAELSRIDGFNGELEMISSENNSLVYWQGMSEAAYEAISALLNEKKIFTHPASIIVYVTDGLLPKLKAANSWKTVYKSPRWAPVCFCSYPYSPKRKRS